jgi:glycerol-3-phosphate dehydrogenase
VVGARRENGLWSIRLEGLHDRKQEEVKARLLVNAAGPWVDRVLAEVVGQNAHNVRLVQGSHIVVKKKFDDPRAYFFQNKDGRIIFAIPYEEEFTLIGTTDRDFEGDPHDVKISEAEIDYLCAAASEYFIQPVKRSDIVWSYSAVRPLFDDGASKAQEATRDYVLKAQGGEGDAPIVNAFGGKITTYRRLSEAMLEKIEGFLGKRGRPWTAEAPLPGGDFPAMGFDAEVAKLKTEYPFLDARLARRLTRLYGTRARALLGLAKSNADLGRDFGADLYEAEVRYLAENEWAMTAEDVLWRRTKRGLHLGREQVAALEEFMRGLPARHIAAAE